MTDARVGKAALKVLAEPSPNAEVGKAALKVLAEPSPNAIVGKVALKALASRSATTSTTGPRWAATPGTGGATWSMIG